MALESRADSSYVATLMVYHGHADGTVSGAVHTTSHTIRPVGCTVTDIVNTVAITAIQAQAIRKQT